MFLSCTAMAFAAALRFRDLDAQGSVHWPQPCALNRRPGSRPASRTRDRSP